MQVATRGRDLEDAKVKAEIARQVLPLIEDVADGVEREAYRQQLARTLHVDERALTAWRPTAASRRRSQADLEPEIRLPGVRSVEILERFCLGLLLRKPSLVYRLDRELQAFDLERLSWVDFSSTERSLIFEAVKEGLAQDEVDPEQGWRLRLTPELSALAQSLVDEASNLDFEAQRAFEAVVDAFLRLRKRNLSDATSQMQYQLLAAQEAEIGAEAEAAEIEHIRQQVQAMAVQRARLEQALSPHGLERAGMNSRGGSW